METDERKVSYDNGVDIIVEKKEKEGFFAKLKNIWNKTIFARKMKENAWKRELREEVKKESEEELKQILKEEYLQRERDRVSGKSKENKKGFMGAMGKLAKALENEGKSIRGDGSNKIAEMLGGNKNNNTNTKTGNVSNNNLQSTPQKDFSKLIRGENSGFDTDIGKILGKTPKQQINTPKPNTNVLNKDVVGMMKSETRQETMKEKEERMRKLIRG